MADTLSTTYPRIRKQRYCNGCARLLSVGFTAERQTYVDMGQAYSLYLCGVCQAYANQLDREYERWDFRDCEDWEALRTSMESDGHICEAVKAAEREGVR